MPSPESAPTSVPGTGAAAGVDARETRADTFDPKAPEPRGGIASPSHRSRDAPWRRRCRGDGRKPVSAGCRPVTSMIWPGRRVRAESARAGPADRAPSRRAGRGVPEPATGRRPVVLPPA